MKIKKMTAFLLAAVMVAVCMPIVSAEGVSLQGAVICIEGREFDATADSSGEGWLWTAEYGLLTLNGYNGGRIELNAEKCEGDVTFYIQLVGENVINNTIKTGNNKVTSEAALSCVSANIGIFGGGSLEMSCSEDYEEGTCMVFTSPTVGEDGKSYNSKLAYFENVILVMNGKTAADGSYCQDGIDSYGTNISAVNSKFDFTDFVDCMRIDGDVEFLQSSISAKSTSASENAVSNLYNGLVASFTYSTLEAEGLTNLLIAHKISINNSVFTCEIKNHLFRSLSSIYINTSAVAAEISGTGSVYGWTPGAVFGNIYTDNSMFAVKSKDAVFSGAKVQSSEEYSECAAYVKLKDSIVLFMCENKILNNAGINFEFTNDLWQIGLDDDVISENVNGYKIKNGEWKDLGSIGTNELGDVKVDGWITAADALLTLQVAVGKTTVSMQGATAIDVDGSENITATDALLILQYAVGKLDRFPAEDKVSPIIF